VVSTAHVWAIVANRGSVPAIRMRESYRDGDTVKNRTLNNLSDGPAARIAGLRAVRRGDPLVPARDGVEIIRALQHGHVLAVLGTARQIKLEQCCRSSSACCARRKAARSRSRV
jgi:hypothetical protein